MEFSLNTSQFEAVMVEITEHASRLNRFVGYPVEAAAVALDYFRRLQLAGLNSEVVGLEI
jgi:hypothetical protein